MKKLYAFLWILFWTAFDTFVITTFAGLYYKLPPIAYFIFYIVFLRMQILQDKIERIEKKMGNPDLFAD